MGLQTRPLSLGGIDYQITTLGTSTGIPIYSRLLKSLGPVARGVMADPVIRQLFVDAQENDDDASKKAKKEAAAKQLGVRFMTLMVEAIEQLPTEFLLELAHTFATVSKVKTPESGGLWVELSDRGHFDQHFAGRYMHLTRWIIEHVKLNFTDFLASLVASVARAPAA